MAVGASPMENQTGGRAADLLEDGLKPVAAIRDPPADKYDWDRGNQPPPERQEKIGEQAEPDEASPENFSFHSRIVVLPFSFRPQMYKNVQWHTGCKKLPILCRPV